MVGVTGFEPATPTSRTYWHTIPIFSHNIAADGAGQSGVSRELSSKPAVPQPAPLPHGARLLVHFMRSGLLAATLPAIHASTSSSTHPTEFGVIWIRIGKEPSFCNS